MKILIIAGTIFELYYLSAVVYLLKSKDKSLEFTLLLRYLFEKNITPEIRNLYSEINLFEIPALTFPLSKNPIKTISNFFKNFYQYLEFKNLIKRIASDVNVICISGFREFFANVLCRVASKDVRLVALRLANQRAEETKEFKRRAVLSFLLNIKNFLFGYSIMDYKFRTDLKNELVTKNFVKYPYHRTISITDYNIGKNNSNYRLPPPFIALKNLYKSDKEKPAILVAGDRIHFHEWTGVDQEKYEEFLKYLREYFSNYTLYFKPRMGKGYHSQYNLEGFLVLPSDISLEELCLRENIKKVISLRSISSKVGVYFGIPGYFIYPLFDLPEEKKQMIEADHDDMRSVIRVNKFEDLMKEPELFIKKYDFKTLISLYWEAIIK